MGNLMKLNLDNDLMSTLKETIDALIDKGYELSKSLATAERYAVMKKLLLEGISKAVLNLYEGGEVKFTEVELEQKREALTKLVEQYFDKRFEEYEARLWENKCNP
jgi:hypothetical protein